MDRQPPAGLDPEDIGSNPTRNRPFSAILETHLSRRGALKGLFAGAAVAAIATGLPGDVLGQAMAPAPFKELSHGNPASDEVVEGYQVQTVIRWGDRVAAGAPAFDVNNLTAAAQEQQFGYNCDFVGFLPLPVGSTSSDHGLLWVNHEYTNTNLMFAGLGTGRDAALKASKAQAEIELAAHGGAVVEIRRVDGQWQVVDGSRYNRRISATTPMAIAGPVRGHDRLKTSADATGTRVLGMLNNCAGGITPWGTVLTAEENFNQYFGNAPDTALNKRYGIGKSSAYSWPAHFARFDVAQEPNESNRFGWMVEIDPYEPGSAPVKRTALGRFKHEGASIVVNRDGRVVVYSGDDERFDYIYRFVSARRFDAANRAANIGILDDGVLSVAKLDDDGGLTWLPLVFGQGPLTAANGFAGQADVLIEARRAADLLGATPMDRPEDVDFNPVTGTIFAIMTNNTSRKAEQTNKANPRPANAHGHIVELIPPGVDGNQRDHTADRYTWSVFLLAGEPGQHGGLYNAGMGASWVSCPDNCAFDSKGRMWIATDGAPSAAKFADGVYLTDTRGPAKALPRLFYQAPPGAEVCGPWLTPDDTTLFLAIQHPGETSGSSFEAPSTRWPDFADGMPPRPSVIAITKKGGGPLA